MIDWLYQPQPWARLILSAVAVGAVGYFVARHVVKPLRRRIPDEQIALYIEEQRTELDGMLITASEFIRKRNQAQGQEGALIDAVLRQAAARSGGVPIGRMADLSRLKKYGLLAAAGIGAYILLGALFPATIAPRFARVLQPWHATDEDLAKRAAAVAAAAPMRFSVSPNDPRLPRGASFDFEVLLSKEKRQQDAVILNFRPKAVGEWQKLPMTELEKLNSFQGSLPDVSEDIDFFVACGNARSDLHHVSVYDPLVVRSLAMTTHFPDYVKQPDRVEDPSTGDVTALVGSQCTLRFVASTPIKRGQIKWSAGETQDVGADAQGTATVSFAIKQDDTYDFHLTDVNGQEASSPAPLSVHCVPDTPPVVSVKSPQGQVLTNPVGEVNFEVEAGDDFGVVALDLVYARIDAQGNQQVTRVPLPRQETGGNDMPHAVAATYRLALEEANPPYQPNDVIPYHVEARDAKGQVTSSPYGMILVDYFEHWGVYQASMAEGGGLHNETGADLMQMLALVWELNNQKTQIKPDELQTRSARIAGKLVDAKGQPADFLNLAEHPERAPIAPLIKADVLKAHDALLKSDTVTASGELSAAVAILAGNGIKPDTIIEKPNGNEVVVGSREHAPTLTMLEQARLSALADAKKDRTHAEEDPAKSAALQQAVQTLLKQQDDLVAHAQELVAAEAGRKTGAKADSGQSQAYGSAAAGAPADAQKKAADLAAKQHELADKTRAAANGQGAGTNPGAQQAQAKTNEAARLMEEASRAFASGKSQEGQQKAAQAQTTLHAAIDSLQGTDRDKLAAAIDDASRGAAILLEKQKDLAGRTAALAKELAGKSPDQRQQRDLKEQAYEQTKLGAQAQVLNDAIVQLNDRAQSVGQQDAIRALTDAAHVMRRSQPQNKLTGAAIDLANANPTMAGAEQKAAVEAIQKLSDSLDAGADALAASREAQLHRAQRVADEAKKGLNALLAKGQKQSATPMAAGQGKQSAITPEKKAEEGASRSEDGNGGSEYQDTPRLAYNLAQLAAVIDHRELIPQQQVDELKEMGLDKTALGKRLAVDPKFLQDVARIVSTISDKIEAELQAKSEAGKLYSSEREECPPNYRPFVNQYFEDLSQVAPAGGGIPAAAPSTAPASP